LKGNDQAIKDNFSQLKILILVANTFTGDSNYLLSFNFVYIKSDCIQFAKWSVELHTV